MHSSTIISALLLPSLAGAYPLSGPPRLARPSTLIDVGGSCAAGASRLFRKGGRQHSSSLLSPRGGGRVRTTTTALEALPGMAAVNNFYQTMPMLAAFATCGIKASAADLVAQKRTRSKERELQFDGRIEIEEDQRVMWNPSKLTSLQVDRNLAFLLYGGLYQGCAQEYMYNHIFPVLFGSGTGPLTVLSKVAFDMMVLTPFLCLPIAYVVKSFIFRHSLNEALEKYADDVKNKGLITKYWSIWGPVQCLTFSIIPEHLRITFIACVSFFWLIIFSTISSGKSASPKKQTSVKTAPPQKQTVAMQPKRVAALSHAP